MCCMSSLYVFMLLLLAFSCHSIGRLTWWRQPLSHASKKRFDKTFYILSNLVSLNENQRVKVLLWMFPFQPLDSYTHIIHSDRCSSIPWNTKYFRWVANRCCCCCSQFKRIAMWTIETVAFFLFPTRIYIHKTIQVVQLKVYETCMRTLETDMKQRTKT